MLENGLVNGTNTFNCTGSTDPNCRGGGTKFQMVFEAGKKYLLRLVNVAIDGTFQFSIDGHSLRVVAHDLVPIVPYTTDSVQITIGQRYDMIVEANAAPGDYWLRAGWITGCGPNNQNPEGMTGIVRYDASSSADPASASTVTPSTSCLGEPLANMVPRLSLDVTNIGGVTRENLGWTIDDYFKWTVNTSSLMLNWSSPTMEHIFNGDDIFPTEYNVVTVEVRLQTI